MIAILRPPRTVGATTTGQNARRLSKGLSFGKLGGLIVVAFFIALFGVASFHGVVVAEQFEFDRLQRRLDDGRERAQVLRNEVARLENPERILKVAEGRLGLVPPLERLQLDLAFSDGSDARLRPPVGNPFGGGSR